MYNDIDPEQRREIGRSPTEPVTTLPLKRIHPQRYKPGGLGSWSGHLPFVHDLVAALRPSLFVELGTHYGESYFGVCQAVEENGIVGRCFAVDTWRGDAHAGFYDDSVFHEVNQYNRAHYPVFSSLLRSTFDDACGQFSDGSIDLLHIDGLHTYDAVKHDFENWLPKVRAGGIVMLHDVEARQADFGVWKFWDELTAVYPHFVFTHSWGLGLIRKPGAEDDDSDLVEQLWRSTPSDKDFIRHYYALKAEAMDTVLSKVDGAAASDVLLQVFPCMNNGYSEEHAVTRHVRAGIWTNLSITLPQGSPGGPIRLDPSDCACHVEFAALRLRREVDGSLLHSWTQAEEISDWQRSDVLCVSQGQTAKFLATDRDPRILLPDLERQIGDQPLILEIALRLDLNIAEAIRLLEVQWNCDSAASDARQSAKRANETEARLEAEAKSARDDYEVAQRALESSLQTVRSERDAAFAEVESLRATCEAVSLERRVWKYLWIEMMGELGHVMHDAEAPAVEPDENTLNPDAIRGQLRAVGVSFQHNRRALIVASGERDRLAVERKQLQSELAAVRAELRKLRIDEMTSTAELRHVELRAKELAGDLDDLRREIKLEREKHLHLQRDLLARDMEEEELREEMRLERAQRIALLNSYSWKVSAPFRRVVDLLHGSGIRR